MTLPSGSTLGPYTIVAPLGAGGMGEVYRAHDTRLGREVAIKILPSAFAGDSERLARFEREAKTLASLNHPHIAAIYGLEETQGATALVMELVDGEDLSAVIARGPISVADVLDIARQLAGALEAAHEAGIIHRDLKPANIKLRDDGTVKVLDFGLAKAMAPVGRDSSPGAVQDLMDSPTMTSPANQGMTAMGMILGTAAYMSPEQARARPVDRRADVWAFGVVLYEMLTGRRAFDGDDVSVTLASVLKDDVAWSALPADLPVAIRRVLRRCLEKDPRRRLNSMQAIAIEIDEARAGGGDDAAVVKAAVAAPARSRVVVVAAVVFATLIIAVAAGVAGGVWSPGAARVTEVEYQPVTFDSGFIFAARFAADPRTVVYSADWDGRTRDIFVTDIESRNARALGFPGADLTALGPSGALALLLDVVPSGNPYVRRGSLARSSITGGAARAEIADVQFSDMAPDGALAVVRLKGTEYLLEYPAGEVIARIPVIGSTYGAMSFVTPRISPDGEHVAVMAPSEDRDWRTHVYRRGGGLALQDAASLTDWWGLAWRSASELWIAGTEHGGRQTRIFALTLDGQRRLVFRAPGALTLHDVSRQGDVLASFDQFVGRTEVLTPSGERHQVTWQDGGMAVGLSDNGLVLTSQEGDGGGPHGSALAWHLGAPQPLRVAEGMALALSPDGARALVTRNGELHVVPTGAGQPQRIDPGPISRFGWTGWHPDGSLLLDVVRQDESRVTIAIERDGRATPLLPPGLTFAGGRLVSSDGRHVIAKDAGENLLLCALPVRACAPLPGTRTGDEVAGWLADNRTLVVFNDRSLPGMLEAIDVGSGRRYEWKAVQVAEPAVSGMRRAIVAPDGTVLVGYDRARTALYVIRGLR